MPLRLRHRRTGATEAVAMEVVTEDAVATEMAMEVVVLEVGVVM